MNRAHETWTDLAAICAVATLSLALLAGCKHETPAQQEQQIASRETSDVAASEKRIREVVHDSGRADQLVALLSELQKVVQNGAASAKEHRAAYAALNANYSATRTDYQSLFARQDARRDALLNKVVTIREQMAALLTDEEWEQLKHDRIKTFDAMLAELRS